MPIELIMREMHIGTSSPKFTVTIRGNRVHITHIFPDVRELKLAEARICSIVDNAMDGIVVINNVGVIENFNPAAEHLFG